MSKPNPWSGRGGHGQGRGRGEPSAGSSSTGRGGGGHRGHPGTASVTQRLGAMNISGGNGNNPQTRDANRNVQSSYANLGQNRNNENAEGRSGFQRGTRLSQAERCDLVHSRRDSQSKHGEGGQPVALVANFFPLSKKPSWTLYNYCVEFKNSRPDGMEETRTWLKKSIVNRLKEHLGTYIFDGSNLYTLNRLHPNPLQLVAERPDGTPFEVTFTLVGEVGPFDPTYLQFFNIIMRKCLHLLGYSQIGRNYYDFKEAIEMTNEGRGITLIPGIISNIRQYEDNLMMCVEISHKVLRSSTCWDLIQEYRNSRDVRSVVGDILISSVVITRYNNKTYRIDDINWEITPRQEFTLKRGERTTLAKYFKDKYQITIRNMDQPILVSKPKQRDAHRGDHEDILLIPELCFPTGLLDSDRSNYKKMQVLSEYLQQAPNLRIRNTMKFMNRLLESKDTRDELGTWGLAFESRSLVEIEQGRILPPETLLFKERNGRPLPTKVAPNADWNNMLKNNSKSWMSIAPALGGHEWVVIVPQRLRNDVPNLVNTMKTVGAGMGMTVSDPAEIVPLQDHRVSGYMDALEYVRNKHRQLKLVFTVMPPMKDTTAVYNAVKSKCLTEYGVLTQCFRQKFDQVNGKLMSIVTKLMVQINAKQGGEPWKAPDIKTKDMIVGFDVHHPGKMRNSGRKSYGAMVATTNKSFSRFFSTVSPHNSREELSKFMNEDIIKCVKAFAESTGIFPANIYFYRDGVGEGQLGHVYEIELRQIKDALKSYYTSANKPEPKLVFIVVTKRGNARIFRKQGPQYGNPPPGTIVDTTITLPERYDFYLVAQEAREKQTVSPTAFNVLHDDIRNLPAEVQALTFRLCHMYFNWAGTVAVPAVCQYAHKLAYLTGTALEPAATGGRARSIVEKLKQFLYYL